MKVKVKLVSRSMAETLKLPEWQHAMEICWPATVRQLPTATLRRMVRWHANGRLDRMAIEDLYTILEELVRRRECSGTPFRSDEEALADLKARCMPHDPRIPHTLTPSPAGRDCLGNGEWPGYECQCDECNHYLACFPTP